MLDTIGNIASTAGFILGLLYSVGLIVVTIHLSRYGITNVYLVQTKYLVVGFVYFMHSLGIGLLAAPVVFALIMLLGLDISSYVAAVAGLLGFLLLLLSSYNPNHFERRVHQLFTRKAQSLDPNVYWRIWRIAVYASFFLAWHSLIRSLILHDGFLRAVAIALVIASFISGVVYYTLFLYRSPISVGNPALELIGGGRPIQVRVTVEKDTIANLQKHGLFSSDTAISKPVLLLDETEQDLIVLVNSDNKERALKLSKSIIQSVIYLP